MDEEKRKEVNAKRREKYRQNSEKILARNREYQAKNREYFANYFQKTYASRKEEMSNYKKQYRKENTHVINACNARRRASKILRTPVWLSEDDHLSIRAQYKIAKEMTKQTGIKYNVDHIVPLQGETVSGLHVPWNLAVITQDENMKKNNKSWPDMWHELNILE